MVDVCFFQTRSRYISAINWYMSTIDVDEINFGLLIDFDLLKARTSTNTKPEVVLCARSRHLEKSIWRDIFAVDDPEWHDSNGDEVKIETEKNLRTDSKVTHIKQQQYFHHLKGGGYSKNSVLYPRRLRWRKYICCFICVTLLWALHIVIKTTVFFTFILIIIHHKSM